MRGIYERRALVALPAIFNFYIYLEVGLLKDVNFPPTPVKYCKQPLGAKDMESHSSIRTLIFQDLAVVLVARAIAIVAALAVFLPVSTYTIL